MDWSLCVICQEKRPSEPLRCPLNSLHDGTGLNAYETFLETVAQFREAVCLPVHLQFKKEENVSCFAENRASWHKSCHLKFSKTKLDKALSKKRKSDDCDETSRRSLKRQACNKDVCIFCGSGNNDDLHQVTTFTVNDTVKMMATELQDTDLLSKLAGTDMIASEAKYHRNCMRSFKNRYRSLLQEKSPKSNEQEQIAEARAFSELVSYMECSAENGVHIFKLSDLHQLYVKRLETFDITKKINKTRLKNEILGHFCDNVKEQSDGKNVILIFSEGLKFLLKNAVESQDFQSEALDFTSVAKNIRREMFENDGFQFSGAFTPGCQIDSMPPNLLYFVSLLLNGPNIQDQHSDISQACLTIAQMIVFNSKKRATETNRKTRHSKAREPPLPIYIGLNTHTHTRSRALVDNLYQLGLSVSYDRVTEITNGLASSVCSQFRADNIVCPSNLRHGLYTVGALDNIDHNPSSTTSQGSFHGTGISVFQFPTEAEPGISRPAITLSNKHQAKDFTLPDNYATVPAVNIKKSNITVNTRSNSLEINGNLTGEIQQEKCWVEHSLSLLESNLVKGNYVSWSGYHASLIDSNKENVVITSLLPMFNEKAASVSMVKHGMDILRNTTSFLNPGQVPVLTVDQPLYTIAKYVQWQWPTMYGESVYVTMLGGLHIEMALWALCGDLLDSSGWTNALTDAGVASSGTAESFLKVSHLARTRHAHQVTVLTLSKLQKEAFQSTDSGDDEESFALWRSDMIKKSPTFQFWDIIIQLEIKILLFIKAHREKKFDLFVEVLEALTPWFFALDHINYSRWVPVFIQDMKSLPDVIKEQLSKFWVIQKSERKFSSIPIDQAHEQNNALVKGSGGAVGLTENPEAFARWMVSGPEQARLLKEFEADLPNSNDENDGESSYAHHEQGLSSQKAFQKQIQNLAVTISEMGNPFTDDSPELIALDTRDCANESVVTTVRTIEDIGSARYKEYVQKVITDKKVSINDPIKKNSLPLFKRQTPLLRSKTSEELSALKNDRNLFSRLYIASQHRDGNLEDFFKHENQPYPPSLSQFGRMRFGKKSDLLKCLEVSTQQSPPSTYDVKIFDGAAIVHALLPGTAITFSQYADKVFLSFLKTELSLSSRIDVVWDAYRSDSLKEATREKRGKGKRKKVGESTKLPRNWQNFLLDSLNKEELFALLSKRIGSFECPTEGKKIFITSGENVMSCGERVMQSCNHEEADTRMIVHIVDALKDGAKSIFVRTVDTDVIVILVGHFHQLTVYGPLDIWVGFGMGKNYRCYHINDICRQLGEKKANALPLFHAFTGCDTTSSFSGRGKKTAWEAWKCYPEATDAFLYMKENPFDTIEITSPHFKTFERLTVLMYDKSSSTLSVNESRRALFTKQNRNLEHIPPTQVRSTS